MRMQRPSRMTFLLALGCAVAGATMVWAWMSSKHSRLPPQRASTRIEKLPAGARTVDLPLMLVADYYEHGIEHAPPRDPSGCMQRRERNYVAPTNPFALLEANLTHSSEDASLMAAATTWRANWSQ